MAFDLPIAVATLWMEARGESEDGQRAVAHVLVNRLYDGRWGHTLASVCLWKMQFSCWNTEDVNRVKMATLPEDDPILANLKTFLNNALSGTPDPTQGATHYYAASMPNPPPWAQNKAFLQIGNHRFLRDIR